MCTLAIDNRSKGVSWSKTLNDVFVELFFETQEHEAESLVMWIITHGELVTESSTYRPYAMEIILSRSYIAHGPLLLLIIPQVLLALICIIV